MKTKLVYVLTCAVEHYFIEQALVSIYTARHYNPDATIVLLVDDLTNKLLVGNRAEILEYISEKIVVELDQQLSMELRSRFLKSSFRNLVLNGDLLFIDCDTLITCPLNEIDNCSFEIGAVLDSHLPIRKYNKSVYNHLDGRSKIAGWDITKEEYYFNSGVVFVKDNEKTKLFFKKWNSAMFETSYKNFIGDQPYFALIDIEFGHLIQKLDDVWNCIMYTQPLFDKQAKIMHFSSYQNMSYVFGKAFLEKVKVQGVKGCEFVKFSILTPHLTYLPFDNSISKYRIKDFGIMLLNIRKAAIILTKQVDACYDYYIPSSGIFKLVRFLFQKRLYTIGALVLTLFKFFKIKLSNGKEIVSYIFLVALSQVPLLGRGI